jgi:uncharacterized protein YecE (DUF72 family)
VNLHIGTSGWSYPDWVGPFYAQGTAAKDYLAAYAEHFRAVEVDATFYSIPSRKAVQSWAERTPESFRFALKVPGKVTHGTSGERPLLEKVLDDGPGHLEAFLEAIEPLGEKLGPLVFQFPYFRVKEMAADDFLGRLERTLAKLPRELRAAVEIRNKGWVSSAYLDLLARHRVAAVLVDHPYMPLPRAQLELGMVTADFAYVRLLGDRYAIERKTTRWGETVEDKSERIALWAEVIREIASRAGAGAAWAFANNHFAGHGPATSRELLSRLRGEG